MLETKGLTKVYKPKKGVPVKALDSVSVKLGDRGMVFLLGKSGSGKSTLLNLLGGLDKYDEGEIIIKGVSSKRFSQAEFDSYRNTYLGFIFQEYNILEEFSVGANVGLALQLQGIKPTDEAINSILREVDLDGYGNRKPNELSGGQKQRVAIARALVKSPEIIMADEPTGALDSNTGKMIFDTLKKLSQTKLVLVVSHDREFAEGYADRIIELADGKIISDVERSCTENKESDITYGDNEITVKSGYHLTEKDLEDINRYIDGIKSGDTHIKVKSNSANNVFVPTDTQKINTEDGSKFKLIKSKLPFEFAFKLGASGLKHKKFRLVMTIILSCIAFCLFGLADTIGAYNHIKTTVKSMEDSKIDYYSVSKQEKSKSGNYYISNILLKQEEIDEISDNTGVALRPVYLPGSLEGHSQPLSLFGHFGGKPANENQLNITDAQGFIEIDGDYLENMGHSVFCGTIPDGSKNEIAISKELALSFINRGYRQNSDSVKEEYTSENIEKEEQLIGKTLLLAGEDYKITGIIDTGFDHSRYASLEEDNEVYDPAQAIINFALQSEYSHTVKGSLTGMIMVGNGALERITTKKSFYYCGYFALHLDSKEQYMGFSRISKLSENQNLRITWIDGNSRTSLGEKELVIGKLQASYLVQSLNGKEDDFSVIDGLKLELEANDSNYEFIKEGGYTIVGIIDDDMYDDAVIGSDLLFDRMIGDKTGMYKLAIGHVPESTKDRENFVSYCYSELGNTRYPLQNSVSFELDMLDSTFESVGSVFLWIGVGFAVFAMVLLSNFIATSISYKKQEIGILRAIGSRGNDVFRIFFSESFIIAAINFVISAIFVGIASSAVNSAIKESTGILITVLNFGIRQVILLLIISLAVAAMASFLPVKKIASKRPIDAIRNR